MIDTAVGTVRRAGRWGDVEGAVADAAALPLADGSADTVLAIHMLYHLADPAIGVRELARVVRQGGAVAVVLNPDGTMAELSRLIDVALDRDASSRTEPLTSEQALPILSGSFRHVERVRFDDELAVADPVDLAAYLLSLPVAEGEGAADKLAAAVGHAFAAGAGPFRIPRQPT